MANSLNVQFRALSDPTRLAVVERLLNGPARVSELAKPYDMALPTFTRHLHVLEHAGLIASKKVGRIRICTINPAAMSEIDQWFSDRRGLWEKRLDALDNFLDNGKHQ